MAVTGIGRSVRPKFLRHTLRKSASVLDGGSTGLDSPRVRRSAGQSPCCRRTTRRHRNSDIHRRWCPRAFRNAGRIQPSQPCRVLSFFGVTLDALEGDVEFADGALQFRVAVPLLDLIQDRLGLLAADAAGLGLEGFAEFGQFGLAAVRSGCRPACSACGPGRRSASVSGSCRARAFAIVGFLTIGGFSGGRPRSSRGSRPCPDRSG